MPIVELKILKTIVSSQFGALSYGDVLRCGEAYARHLVEDLAAAKYVNQQPTHQLTPPAVTRKGRIPRKKRSEATP